MSVTAKYYFNKSSPLRSSLRKHKTEETDISKSDVEDNRQKSPSRKTVSFCSDKKVLNVPDCLQAMQKGTELIKLRTNVRQFRRFFSLDEDFAYIRWHPTNKKPHKARIAVESIREVRVGWNTELFCLTKNNGLNDIQEVCAFSIIYGQEYECLDLIALTPDDANVWVIGLMALINNAKLLNENESTATLRERWLTKVFNEADVDNKEFINENTAVSIIKRINSHLHISRIKQKIKESSTMAAVQCSTPTKLALNEIDSRGKIDFNQFIEIYRDVATRPEIYFLMIKYANKDYLSCQDLQLFLETEQGILGVTKEFCKNIIDEYEPCPEAKKNSYMTVDGFTNYLLSSANSIFDPSNLNVCQNMDLPFNRYFISTSYNTYFVEDQLKGPCSVDGYISALKRNCRFIELDLWDPETDEEINANEPLICNGGTMAPKLSLTAALKIINELAFECSKYPLFIRLEMHLSLLWQKKLVELLENCLGTKLYKPLETNIDYTDPENIPTPERFINKIILTSKCYKTNNNKNNFIEKEEFTEEDEGCDLLTGKARKEKKRVMYSELKDLIAPFACSKHLKFENNFDLDKTISSKTHILSITENDCLQLLQQDLNIVNKNFQNYLIRVTPNFSRIDSSNLNPQDFWNYGINFVALNYQTPGLMMDLQEGKFAANGGCGYVLKPPIMFDEIFVSSEKLPLTPQVLHLKILSAQQLQKPRGSTAKGDSADPFVVVEIYGIAADCAEERTKTVRNDSFNPNFDETFQFEIYMPELALVRFLLLDDDYIGDDFIGQYTIPFECLQSGYRHIPLLNNEGDLLQNSTLFVHIAITNRYGGGKAKKRGMSVKRKTTRIQTGIKLIGIKNIDELFKIAIQSITEYIEYRSQLETALGHWLKECGFLSTGNIQQSIKRIHSRVSTVTNNESVSSNSTKTQKISITENKNTMPSFLIGLNEENQPTIKIFGTMSESIQKSFLLLENFLEVCKKGGSILDKAMQKINEIYEKVNEYNSDFLNLNTKSKLRSQKSTRTHENFSWNLQLLKTQITLIQKTQTEINNIFFQIVDTAKILGIFDEKSEL